MKLESVKVFPSRRELREASYQADPRLYTELRDTYATQFERIVDDLRASCDLGAQMITQSLFFPRKQGDFQEKQGGD
jgi:hypothetical protein